MSQPNEKTIKKYPEIIFYIISVLIDLYALYGIIQEMGNNIPNAWKVILFIFLILVTIALISAYHIVNRISKSVKARTEALADLNTVTSYIHDKLIHIIRDEYGNLKRSEYLHSDITPTHLKETIQTIVDGLADLITRLTYQKVCVCIKLRKGNLEDDNIQNGHITTFIRSGNSDKNRKKSQDPISIKGNTDFEHIWKGNNFFACGDLASAFSRGRYHNTTEDFGKYYNSTFVVPIRMKSERYPDGILSDGTEVYDLHGFLCFDSKRKNPSWENQNDKLFNIAATYADAIYILVREYSDAIKKIGKEGSDVDKQNN